MFLLEGFQDGKGDPGNPDAVNRRTDVLGDPEWQSPCARNTGVERGVFALVSHLFGSASRTTLKIHTLPEELELDGLVFPVAFVNTAHLADAGIAPAGGHVLKLAVGALYLPACQFAVARDGALGLDR
jgi:hypothetical protein